MRIIRQAVERIPDGPDHGEGAEGDQAAGWRGLRLDRSAEGRTGIFRRERRLDSAYRVRVRPPSFVNLQALDRMVRARWLPMSWRSSAR